jgi:RimJ/RimL family protein N-acetyltransferase
VNLSEYSAVETLRNGRRAEIRALKPADRAAMLEAVAGMSEAALYRRFFAPKRSFSEKEIEYYLNVDFVNHVALVAVVDDAAGPVLAGGARYIVTAPGRAEVAFSVDDAHQGQGIASAVMRHLAGIARAAGLKALNAEVLPENAPMLKVFERCGLAMTTRREAGVVHVALAL